MNSFRPRNLIGKPLIEVNRSTSPAFGPRVCGLFVWLPISRFVACFLRGVRVFVISCFSWRRLFFGVGVSWLTISYRAD